ncbi:uncharacterized protein Triagg1_7681 [Trichoderma aggressivum f. europaeum]|uniref:Uncharacterized protein n=1 Tax=Trichoderma aggressivum f. europaeum TaxID=173218 RepID=A0AAE1I990_9HYPO|nr:hypothetical protein Triagg1_7681 [Trichoderma aggressivum f. europaeum]
MPSAPDRRLMPSLSTTASIPPLVPSSAPSHAIVAIKSRDIPGGASYSVLRLPQEPRPNPTTVADRLAATLIRHLENSPDNTFLLTAGHIKFVPARVGASSALRDCVALLCSTWTNFRRALPVEQLVNPDAYGKALRSLQIALNDEHQQLSTETLAAVTILERVEILFDASRPRHRALHGQGMYGLMLQRGPPRLSDELDTCLAFDNLGSLLALSLVEGKQVFYLTPQWKEKMDEALRNSMDIPGERLDAYALDLHGSYWPSLVHQLRFVHNNPNTISKRKSAASLRVRVLNIIPELKVLGERIVEKVRRLGNIIELPDNESPLGMKYHSGNMGSAQCWITYKMLSIVLNRILRELASILDEQVTLLDHEHTTLCRDICMCVAYIGTLGTLPAISTQPPLFMAYEGVDEIERAYLRNFIRQSDKFKKRLPRSDSALENFVLNTAYALTGREKFL